MHRLTYFLFLTFLTLGACNNGPESPITTPGEAAVQEPDTPYFLFTFTDASPTCETADSMRCARVEVNLHMMKGQQDPASQKINTRLKEVTTEDIYEFTESEATSAEIGSAAQAFIEGYESFANDSPGYLTPWAIEVNSEVLKMNDKILSVSVDHYSYTGGAHPNYYTSMHLFDRSSGEEIEVASLIRNQEALLDLAENKFRTHHDLESGQELADVGFFFDQGFSLPANMGFNEAGLLLIYNPYEVAPYALGMTQLLLSFEEIKGMIDLSMVSM
ncbi:MAG: DUF3298 and DUF4163 domain-containing protein [Bacteroidetes bacterium]|nr:DUF3298 and DUF4163 domain-containing protein [Bacteroidota bacterium]